MDLYPIVLPHNAKISLEGLRVLCLRWWKGMSCMGCLRSYGTSMGALIGHRREKLY